jgi:hypothetical protein
MSLWRLSRQRRLRPADVRVPRGLSPRGGLRAAGVTLAGLLAAAGCQGTVETPDIAADQDVGLGCLPPDDSEGIDSAWTISAANVAAGNPVSDTLCPKYDEDYWQVNVAGDDQLLHVDLELTRVGTIDLSIEVFGPKSLCVPSSPTACPCDTGQCDETRGGCRSPQANVCFESAHCDASESCVADPVDNLFGAFLAETYGTTNSTHLVDYILPAFGAGNYFLKVFDRAAIVEDENAEYSLTVTQMTDPDADNEPNDAPQMARQLTNDSPVDGFFSYHNDVDYYVINPAGSVVEIELSWPTGMTAEPTWEADQAGSATLPAPAARTVVGGSERATTRVFPSVEPITIRVWNEQTNPVNRYDLDTPYTLRVRAFEDPHEGATRDDSADQAQKIDIDGGSATQGLVATNDVDWYHVTNIPSQNGLMDISLVANYTPPVEAPFLLKFQVYYVSDSQPCPCPSSLGFGVNKECLEELDTDGTCADWYQRPQIFIPEEIDPNYDWKLGGPTPNNLSARIPTYGDREIYILVSHIQNNPLGYAGYHDTETYALSLTRLSFNDVDPADQDDPNDNGTLSTDADNYFIPEPLAGYYDNDDRWTGVDYDSFHRSEIEVPATWNTSGGGTVTEDYAVLTSVSFAPDTCTPLTFDLFDGAGGAAPTSANTTITSSFSGALFTDAACTLGLPGSVIIPDTTVYFQAAAGTGTISTNAGTLIPFAVEVTAAPSPRLTLTGPSQGELDARSEPFTVTLPAAVPTGSSVVVNMNLYGSGDGIACAATGLAGDTCLAPTTCDLGGTQTACDVTIEEGATERSFYVMAGTGSARLIVVQVSAAGYLGTTRVYAARPPVVWVYDAGDISGVLSYPGDNDFFSIPVPDATIGNGTMWATLTYASTGNAPRVNIARQASRGSMPSGGAAGISIRDCSSSPCTVGDGESRCYYVTSSGGFFNIWVNDELHDEPPPGAQENGITYDVSFTFQEGCASFCHEYACQ